LTLLNTVANLGGTWPKFFILLLVDFFTERQCISATTGEILSINCAIKAMQPLCVEAGGTCIKQREGYYPVGFFCITVGILLYFFLRKTLRRLQSLHDSSWTLAVVTPEHPTSDRQAPDNPIWSQIGKSGSVFNT
jgi:MFS transporter, PAT family, solute carrier family 33 (acetyl-CoA transportor), member 1